MTPKPDTASPAGFATHPAACVLASSSWMHRNVEPSHLVRGKGSWQVIEVDTDKERRYLIDPCEGLCIYPRTAASLYDAADMRINPIKAPIGSKEEISA